jgi:hypothetical protein
VCASTDSDSAKQDCTGARIAVVSTISVTVRR